MTEGSGSVLAVVLGAPARVENEVDELQWYH